MTVNTFAKLIVVALSFAIWVGCVGKKATDEIDYGTVNNSVYRNEFFGFQMTLPSKWSIQDQASREQLADVGTEMMIGDRNKIDQLKKASQLRSINLLAAFKHPIGAVVDSNPSIVCVAERVNDVPGIRRGRDYHRLAKPLLQAGQVSIEFPKEVYSEKLGGIEFDVLYSLMHIDSTTVQQKYYATILNGYALVFVVSYTKPDEEQDLQTVLKSVAFD